MFWCEVYAVVNAADVKGTIRPLVVETTISRPTFDHFFYILSIDISLLPEC